MADAARAPTPSLRRRALAHGAYWFLVMGPHGLLLPYFALYLRDEAGLSGARVGAVFAVMPLVAMASQPLWGLWDMAREQSDTALTGEFIALANHRKAIRTEIASYSVKFRRMQLDAIARALARYGIDARAWPPAFVILCMNSISRQLLVEDAFGVDIGHAQAIAFIERHIRELEGPRERSRSAAKRRAAAGS